MSTFTLLTLSVHTAVPNPSTITSRYARNERVLSLPSDAHEDLVLDHERAQREFESGVRFLLFQFLHSLMTRVRTVALTVCKVLLAPLTILKLARPCAPR